MDCNLEPIQSKTSIAQKVKSQQYAHNVKFGSPKLRDLLRQKCRIRMKESRQSMFNNKRFMSTINEDVVSTVIKDELKELNFDIESQDRIYEELKEEAQQWWGIAVAAADQSEVDNINYLIEYSEDATIVFFCPVCQRSALQETPFGHVLCTGCGLKYRCSGSMDHFQYAVQRKLVEHETHCAETVHFFAEPFINAANSTAKDAAEDVCGLNIFCDHCDFYVAKEMF